MTDYGPGHGSPPWRPEPWHPDDPLGDQGWDGGQQQGGGWDPYAQDGQQYPTGQYPQAQQPQQDYNTGQYPQQQYPQQGQYPQDQYQQQGYPQQHPQQPQYPEQGTGQWATGQLPVQDYPDQTYGWNVSPAQPPYAGQQYDTGQYPVSGYDAQGYGNDAYGNDVHGGAEYPQQGVAGYPGQQQTGYYAPQAPDPSQQPAQQVPQQSAARPAPPAQRRPPAAEQTGEWNPFEEESDEPETHPFFTRGSDADDSDEEYERRRPTDDDDDDDYDELDTGRRAGRDKKRGGGTKRRSGCACLAVVVALGGGVGTAGWIGYQYYESHYAPPPDWSGAGSGSVQVQIPDSATLAAMGNILKKDGVVKSVDAFTRAAAADPKGSSIQGGVYQLHREMSAASAVTLMLDPSAQSSLTVPEGWRASQVYEALDKRLGLTAGSAERVTRNSSLGLPSYDTTGNPEGFLFPSRYGVAKGGKVADVLKQMVQRAEHEYTADDLKTQAAKIGKTPYQIIVIASLVQAEAQEPQDFGKVSRVIYNRLEQDMALGFDSTINYAKGRSTLDTTTADTHFASPYNTYLHKGLPPGPIDNPGHQAIEAALHPTAGDWLYFVTVKPGDTRFTASAAQHQRNVDAFNQYQREHSH